MNPAAAAIRSQRLVAIIRRASAEQAAHDGELLLKAGVRAVEVSLTTPDAFDAIERLVAVAPPGTFVGAGTVTAARQVRLVAELGARFVVSPVFEANVVQTATEFGLASIPGVATPTEALAAFRAHADLIKLFPASLWRPGSVADLLAAMPDLPLVPTGGISAADALQWIKAGAVAVGLGSALNHDPAGLLAALSEAVLPDSVLPDPGLREAVRSQPDPSEATRGQAAFSQAPDQA